jgi:hypothetical protein
MKRIPSNRPVASMSSEARREVAGGPVLRPVHEVASCLGALDDPFNVAGSAASLVEDFAEFLAGDEASVYGLQPPDPAFREKLRRRLWRLHALTRLRNGEGTH